MREFPTALRSQRDAGISHSFEITEDQFATGNRRLINHKKYYYTVLAYAHNNYKTYNPSDPNALDGQQKPYKAGRRNIKTYEAIPHRVESGDGGTVQNSDYGDGPQIQRLDGTGNAGIRLDLTQASIDTIVMGLGGPNGDAYHIDKPVYDNGAGPLNIKVIDPLMVPDTEFELIFDGVSAQSNWVLVNLETDDSVHSESAINVRNEQLVPQWGISLQIERQDNPGNNDAVNGFITASIEYENESRPWLFFIPDGEGASPINWIRSGTSTGDCSDWSGVDDEEVYESVLGGTWAPYRLVSNGNDPSTFCNHGPAWEKFQALASLSDLNSVDIVFTSDRSMWTRVPVLETQDEDALALGGAEKMNLRESPSVDKDGNAEAGTGWSWFPGYAIDLELGVRLNMMFGEDSWLGSENGQDMVFNPSSNVATPLGQALFGGKHYIYVMGTEYVGDDEMDNPHYDALLNPTDLNKRTMLKECRWVSIPMWNDNHDWLDNDVRVSLRVSRRYGLYEATNSNGGIPHYMFDTRNIATVTNDATTAENELANIRVVPNPYYAYSDYEQNQLDNRVKITNLPNRCIVSIYTVNGTLIRRFDKDSPETFLEWDLKNSANIPIASGMYVIHVEVENVGEAYVKWFGSMRPVDLDTF
jgi:hypothetical protein